jgi:serine/threonine protein kinase
VTSVQKDGSFKLHPDATGAAIASQMPSAVDSPYAALGRAIRDQALPPILRVARPDPLEATDAEPPAVTVPLDEDDEHGGEAAPPCAADTKLSHSGDDAFTAPSAELLDFINQLLTKDASSRPSARQALLHPWLTAHL